MTINERATESIQTMPTSTGEYLGEMSKKQPIMLVFLRHFGCTFCREALSEISMKREELVSKGTEIVFVHMADNETATRYFKRYNLDGAIHISDPECTYYAAFGLVKANATQLMGLRVWMRGFNAGVVGGHGIGKLMGDSFQMPGIFLIQDGQIRDKYIHKLSSDKPDYAKLTECCQVG